LQCQTNAIIMKWSELRKIVEAKGWIFSRHGSRHDIYLHPEHEEPLQIERHWSQEIRKGLYKKIKKQVGF